MTIELPLRAGMSGTWGQLRALGAAAEGVQFNLGTNCTSTPKVSGYARGEWMVRNGVPVPGYAACRPETWGYIGSKTITIAETRPVTLADYMVPGEAVYMGTLEMFAGEMPELVYLSDASAYARHYADPEGQYDAKWEGGALVLREGSYPMYRPTSASLGDSWNWGVIHMAQEGLGPLDIGTEVGPEDIQALGPLTAGMVLKGETGTESGLVRIRWDPHTNQMWWDSLSGGSRVSPSTARARIASGSWYSNMPKLAVYSFPHRLLRPAEEALSGFVDHPRFIPPPSPEHPSCPVCRRSDINPAQRHREIRGYTAPWCAGGAIGRAFAFPTTACTRCTTTPVWGVGMCSACQATTEKRRTGQFSPEDLRFGLELETEGLGWLDPDAYVGHNSYEYTAYKLMKAHFPTWSAKNDGSLRNRTEGEITHAEVVSPPLPFTPENLATVRDVVTRLNMAGARAFPDHCGVHVHVGMEDISDEQLVWLAEWWYRWQDVVMAAHPPHPTRAFYCEKLKLGARSTILLRRTRAYILASHQTGYSGRYYALNWQALNKYNTVEWRLFNGTTSAAKVAAYVELAVRMTHYGITHSTEPVSPWVAGREQMVRLLDDIGVTDKSVRWHLLGTFRTEEDRPVPLPAGWAPKVRNDLINYPWFVTHQRTQKRWAIVSGEWFRQLPGADQELLIRHVAFYNGTDNAHKNRILVRGCHDWAKVVYRIIPTGWYLPAAVEPHYVLLVPAELLPPMYREGVAHAP